VHSAGRLLASASNDHTVRIWAIDQPSVPCLAVLHTNDVTNVVTSAWRPAEVGFAALAPPQLLSISSAG
jgi:WD40 repeat protein